MNYTYIPDPKLKPEDLYNFDSVDTITGANTASSIASVSRPVNVFCWLG